MCNHENNALYGNGFVAAHALGYMMYRYAMPYGNLYCKNSNDKLYFNSM